MLEKLTDSLHCTLQIFPCIFLFISESVGGGFAADCTHRQLVPSLSRVCVGQGESMKNSAK